MISRFWIVQYFGANSVLIREVSRILFLKTEKRECKQKQNKSRHSEIISMDTLLPIVLFILPICLCMDMSRKSQGRHGSL